MSTRRSWRSCAPAICATWLAVSACDERQANPALNQVRVASRADELRPPVDSSADLFLGQSTANFGTPNLTDAIGLYNPDQLALDTSISPARVYVADKDNSRVLAWNNATGFVNGAPADLVIGQVNALGSVCNQGTTASAATLCTPRGVVVDAAGNLYVSDSGNHRVLYYATPFSTDLVADRVYGQSSFALKACNGGAATPSASTLCTPMGLALDGTGNLFVTDQANHRVLRYNAPLTDTVADGVLGQGDFVGAGPNRVDGSGLNQPRRMAIDKSVVPNHLYVADTSNNRVLGWPDALAFANGAPATLIIGQASAANGACNRGAAAGPDTLCNPVGVAVDGAGNLFVADNNNSRVLEYNTPFTTDGTADKVFGQPNFTQTGCYSASATTLCYPEGVAAGPGPTYDLFIADTQNSRVLRYASGALGDSTADQVFGQAGSFTSGGSNNGGTSPTSLYYPHGVAVDGSGNVYVADGYNSRVLGFSGSPLDATADVVFGQGGSFTSSTINLGGLSGTSLYYAADVAVDGAGNLWISDQYNYRVMGFTTPMTDQTADVVLGKPNLTTSYCYPPSASCTYYTSPLGVAADGAGNVWLGDSNSNRVLEFNLPLTTDTTADKVLGQLDFSSTGQNLTDASGLFSPWAVAVDTSTSPNHLYVADTNNNRVLGWSTSLFTNGLAADKVFGQATASASVCSYGNGGTMCAPHGLAAAGGNLFATDTNASRVLRYDTPYSGGDTTADRVLGQTTLNNNGCNAGSITSSAANECSPSSVTTDSLGNVYVTDTGNHRILRYNVPFGATPDGNADAVLGQLGFNQNGANRVDSAGLSGPHGVAIDKSVTPNRVYVVDTSNSRVLGWPDVTAFTNGSPATLVIGQAALDAFGCNNATLSASSLCQPYEATVDSLGNLYVADQSNNRVLIYNSPFTTDTVADKVLGQPNFTSNSSNQGLANPSASTLSGPWGVAVDASGNLFVSDRSNNRILGYLAPLTGDAVADVVIGQADYIGRSNNRGLGTPAANTLYYPSGLALDSSVTPLRLYATDYYNARVLAFDDPLTDGTADQVLGQPGFTTNLCYYGGATHVCYPNSVAVDGLGNVFTSEQFPSRVMQWNTPKSTDSTADVAFGQLDLNQTGCNNNATNSPQATSLCYPSGMASDSSGNLYVADTNNNRVSIYFANNRPTATALTLTPASPDTNSTLTAAYTYTDADGDAQSGTVISWYKNTVLQAGLTGLTVAASLTTRGEVWYFTVRPKDGSDFGPLATSPSVTIQDLPPVATSPLISPAAPKRGDVLTATYGFTDGDGDTEAASDIKWYRNNVLQSAYNGLKTLPAAATVKGDIWYFTVAPGDGTALGAMVTSPVLTIGNTAPTASALTLTPSSPTVSDSLTAAWTFADVDGDLEAGSQVRWYKNTVLQAAYNDAKLVPSPLTANDNWYYTLTPKDGVSFGTLYTSPTVTVGSTAPVATALTITPSPAFKSSTLQRNYTYTGLPEAASVTRWYKGGVEQVALMNSATVASANLAKGQVWYFTIQPCDNTPRCGTVQTSPSTTIANSPPSSSVPVLTPASPDTNATLTCTYTFTDVDGDAQSGTEIRWYKNGTEQVALLNQATAGPALTSRGDNWYCTVQPSDGVAVGALVTSNTANITNSPPVATLPVLTPALPTAGSSLGAAWTFTDADGDFQTGTEVRWYKNGAEDVTLLNQLTVPPTKLFKGNTWYFTVKPNDGIAFGALITSATVTVQNSPPVASALTILPTPAPAGAALTGSYTYADVDGDLQNGSEIRWYKNGVEVVALFGLLTVPAGQTARGQIWTFSVKPKDGTIFGAPVTSPNATISNSAPTVSGVSVTPASPKTDDVLTATYTYADADGDAETGSEIRWYRNGTEVLPLFGLPTVAAINTTRGESWYFTVKPYDGTDYGMLATSAPQVIQNTPPVASAVNIAPLSPKTTDSLTASYTYADADADAQQGSEIRWYKNGVEQVAYFNLLTVPAGVPKSGETWNFTVKPKDGVTFGTLVTSTSVVIGSSAPVATALTITPPAPKSADVLTAYYLYSSPDGLPESGSVIKWYRNAVEVVGLTTKTVPTLTAKKGEAWHFTVQPKDGTVFGLTQTSANVTILNTPPVASNAGITPANPVTTNPLTAVYAYADDDADVQSASEIRWYRNGLEQVALLNLKVVPATATKKNEVWYYRVRPNDGADFGQSEVSSPAFIANSPPIANAGPDQTLVPTAATQRVTLDGSATTDADNDVLSFTWTLGSTVLGSGAVLMVDLPLGTSTIQLSVTDGDVTATDTVVIDIANPKPTLTVPADFTAAPGLVDLKATATDGLNRPLTFAWTQTSGDPVTLQNPTQATARYFALKAGPRTFTVTALAATTPSAPASLTVTTRNDPPWAVSPVRQVVSINAEVTLDGRASSDPNADPLTYVWALDPSGLSSATVTDADQPQGKVTPTADGRYFVSLKVNDGTQDSNLSLTEVVAIDPAVTQHVPFANAGPDGVGEVGAAFALDGRGSYDLDGDPLTYTWRRISGPTGLLVKGSTAQPTFRADSAGVVVLGLVVSDGKSPSPEDTVSVDVVDPAVNHRPIARPGTDTTAQVGTAVALDGSKSVDPDGDPLTFAWTQLAGPPVSFDDATLAKPTFVALRPGAVQLALTVSDGKASSLAAPLTVLITTAPNTPPVANAGPDQTLVVGGSIQLDGSASHDAENDPLRFVWEQVEGPPVVLSGTPSGPSFRPPGLGRYRFKLTVWDAEAPSFPDEVLITLSTHGPNNQAPKANAGKDLEAPLGTLVTLDGSASSDPDPMDKLSFEWTFVAFPTGSEPPLTDGALARPSFTPAAPGPYTLRLVVNDGDLSSPPSYVTVIAIDPNAPKSCGCGESGSGGLWVLGLLALGSVAARRRRLPAVAVLLGIFVVAAVGSSAEAAVKKKAKPKPAASKPAPAPVVDDTPAVEATPPSTAPVAAPGGGGPANPYLDEAKTMYANFQLEGIIPKLEFALAVKGVTVEQKVEIFKLMAFTHASFDDQQKAEEAFSRLLDVQPKYELSGASPKLRTYFANAQRQFRERQAVKLQHAPPRMSGGVSTTVDVVAVAGAERVTTMTLHYRAEGSQAGYSQTEMQAGEKGAFSAVVPNLFPGPAGKQKIEYFVRARDKAGGLLASVGEESQPLVVEIETVEARGTPVYKSGWFWGAIGVGAAAVAAGVATPFLLKKNAVPPTGSLGTEHLP